MSRLIEVVPEAVLPQGNIRMFLLKSKPKDYTKVKAKKWIKARPFDGFVKKDDFKLVKEAIPELRDGQVLFEAMYLTVDPYMRVASTWVGRTMPGQQVAKVVVSKNPQYPVGGEYVCQFGWRSHTIYNPKVPVDTGGIPTMPETVYPLPDLGKLPQSVALGTVGMPGVTAYLALTEVGDLKSGDIVLINCAAGAVGSVAGQIAKMKGCKVIGYAGSENKVKYLKEELGFDYAYNYKREDLDDSLEAAAPKGVDVYFDNVGGDFSNTVITRHMKMFGRVVLIGSISTYNAKRPRTGPELYNSILTKSLAIRGFAGYSAPKEKWIQAMSYITKWLREGKLKYHEHVSSGFDSMPTAFMGLFTGDNTGKAIVKI